MAQTKEKEMITLTYANLRDGMFHQTMSKLMRCPGFRPKTAYKVAKIGNAIRKELEIHQGQFEALVKKYAKLDDKGELLPMMENEKPVPGTFEIKEEVKDDWTKEHEEFLGIEFKIDLGGLPLDDLEPAKLTPAELTVIEPLLKA